MTNIGRMIDVIAERRIRLLDLILRAVLLDHRVKPLFPPVSATVWAEKYLTHSRNTCVVSRHSPLSSSLNFQPLVSAPWFAECRFAH